MVAVSHKGSLAPSGAGSYTDSSLKYLFLIFITQSHCLVLALWPETGFVEQASLKIRELAISALECWD